MSLGQGDCDCNANDQLTESVSDVNGTTSYEYNANGELTGKYNPTTGTEAAYSYNVRGRLSGAHIYRTDVYKGQIRYRAL
jgi:YD repeat-containing protein